MIKRCISIYRYYSERVTREDTTSLSYYLLLSIVPAITLIVLIADGLSLDAVMIQEVLSRYLTLEMSTFIMTLLARPQTHYLSYVSFAICLYVASQGFYSMQVIMDRLYERDEEDTVVTYLKQRGISMFNTLLFIMLLMGLIFVMAIVPTVHSLFDIELVSKAGKYITLFGFMSLIMLMLNLIVPTFHLKIKEVILGSLLSAGAILAITYGLSIYIRYASYETLYGPLASVAIALLALNLISNAIYAGVCLNAYLYDRKK